MNKRAVNRTLSLWLMLIGICAIPFSARSQQNGQGNALKKQIRLTDRLLEETKDKQHKAYTELSLVKKRVEMQQDLIIQFSEDIQRHEIDINLLEEQICILEEQILVLKEEYARTARQSYKCIDSEHFWLSIFSAESLSEAWYRSIYYRDYARYRRHQIELLAEKQSSLHDFVDHLNQNIAEKEALIEEKHEELASLDNSQKLQLSLYTSLAKQSKKIKGQQKDLKTELDKLLVATEPAIVIKDRPIPKQALEPAIKDENLEELDMGMSRAFEKYKGHISWPIIRDQGIVVQRFGKQKDDHGNQIECEGIKIRVPSGEAVRAVFSGTVTGVRLVPMMGNVVIIEHGEYRTVYANLATTSLEEGDEVALHERIGTVRTDGRTGETRLEFMIYKRPKKFLDPEAWLEGT